MPRTSYKDRIPLLDYVFHMAQQSGHGSEIGIAVTPKSFITLTSKEKGGCSGKNYNTTYSFVSIE